MTLASKVYFYERIDDRHQLYAGQVSTTEGLACFDPSAAIRIVRFGADRAGHAGWMTSTDLPALGSVADLSRFLDAHDRSLDLVDLEVEVGENERLSTHDDGECTFTFADRARVEDVVHRLAPARYAGALLDALGRMPGVYVTCDDAGTLAFHASFEASLGP